jgi:hypothetical protein
MSENDKISIHIDAAAKRADLPDCGGASKCERSDCPAPHFETGFGLAGGGFGVYEFCPVCGSVVSKTEVDE